MSWSTARTGTPEEVGDAIKRAILDSANYLPASPRRSRTAEIVATNARNTIVASSEHGVTTGTKPPTIVGHSAGHINDDGSLSHCTTTFAFVREKPPVAAEPAAPGPDAATSAEVDAALSSASALSNEPATTA
jgi:hypothetical protein